MAETLRSSGRVSIAVALSRVLGLVREQVFAAMFGASMAADAYAVAFRIPNLLRDLFAEGALSSAFVPTFAKARTEEDQEAAYQLGHFIFTGLLLVTGLLTALGVVFADELVAAIANGFEGNSEKAQLATQLTQIMMPLLSIISLSAVWMGMLNAQSSFMAPAYAPAMFNVASIAVGGTLLVLGLGVQEAIFWWAVGTVMAGVVQATFQLPALRRLGYRPRLRLRGFFRSPRVRKVLTLMAPAIVGLAAVQINVFVNTRFAASLPDDGPIAQLSYAFRVFYLPIGVFSVAVATVTTTRVSEDAARKDFAALTSSAGEGLSAVWMLMSASAVGLFILAEPVVQLLFERGAFEHQATIETAAVLRSYTLGLLPYGLVKVLAPVFYSIDRPRIPLIASVSAVVVNITFNALTYEQLGAPGIALGTTLGVLVNVLVLRVGFARVIGHIENPRRLREFAALVLANAIMGGAVWGTWWGVERLVEGMAWGGSLVRGLALLAACALGFVLFVAVARLLRYPGAELLANLPKKILGRLGLRRG